MKAMDIMTSRPVSIGADASIQEAIALMLRHRISGLPVVDGEGRVAGVVTEGDFLRRAETGTAPRRRRWIEFLLGPGRTAAEYTETHGRKVGDVMTRDPRTIDEETPLPRIVDLMEGEGVKRLPVTRDGRLVGIVSRANILQAVAGLPADATAPAPGDSAIRERILAEFAAESWAPMALVNVTVRDGEVDLWGTLVDDRQRRAICVAAENVPGVKRVRDHLVWEPVAGLAV